MALFEGDRMDDAVKWLPMPWLQPGRRRSDLQRTQSIRPKEDAFGSSVMIGIRKRCGLHKISGREEEVRVKESEFGIKAESDDVKRLAKKYGIPYREVAEKADRKCKEI